MEAFNEVSNPCTKFYKAVFIVLPFYYLLAYPIAYILNHIDLAQTHRKELAL